MKNPFIVMKEVEDYFHLEHGSLVKQDRKPRIVLARSVAAYILRYKIGLSLNEVGDYLDRDHSTVFKAIKNLLILLEKDDFLSGHCSNLILKYNIDDPSEENRNV